METAIAVRNDGSITSFLSTWEQRKQVAQTLIVSGFLPPAFTKPEQVLAVMLTAHELHIPEMEALRSINVIQGKPTISPQLMLALARRTGELEDIKFDRTDHSVVCTVKRRGQSPFAAEFGVKEATAMGLNGKDNYKKQPFTMYQWRALAANLRVTFGDAITGLYTPEELGAEVSVTDDGEQVVVAPELPEATEPKAEPVTASGATFQTFDPTVETITFGKYAGMRWAELPSDYLQWMAGNGKAEAKQKAEATLKVLEAVQEQKDAQPSVVDSMFPGEVKLGERETAGFISAIAAAKNLDGLKALVDKAIAKANSGEITDAQKEEIAKATAKKQAALEAK